MQIYSRFTVTEYVTGNSYEETVEGVGQEGIKNARDLYKGIFCKFVLDGFEIKDKFIRVQLRK